MEDIGDIVKASLGPLPTVCQEQVMLDMERARMQAEDNRAALIRTEKKSNVWRSRENMHFCNSTWSEMIYYMCTKGRV